MCYNIIGTWKGSKKYIAVVSAWRRGGNLYEIERRKLAGRKIQRQNYSEKGFKANVAAAAYGVGKHQGDSDRQKGVL